MGNSVAGSGGNPMALVEQPPWIFTETIRENICFGNEYQKDKFDQIVQLCELTYDFESFANEDLTWIGEKGTTLTGG